MDRRRLPMRWRMARPGPLEDKHAFISRFTGKPVGDVVCLCPLCRGAIDRGKAIARTADQSSMCFTVEIGQRPSCPATEMRSPCSSSRETRSIVPALPSVKTTVLPSSSVSASCSSRKMFIARASPVLAALTMHPVWCEFLQSILPHWYFDTSAQSGDAAHPPSSTRSTARPAINQ